MIDKDKTIKNLINRIIELEKERDYYKKMYVEFNNAFIKGKNTEE